ncbi:hypothetical protein BEWA_035360 [Theileria equi strain WA]|uniref:Signal peptide containing protein n=1 Tax=Theileria equi strain WA TaxID=1537102 RepID=L1LE25_THEEQ|nr:hypothetical protein BEWA_035360 [Theileria equi strain WA]EKX73500.1 hypothetical protein BEWA_035360 [Theileria equi strain WA]|eukprot:XP_004832952.1 hypothetical protein BEWA_035360 [Theileria equi strain WA]
MKEALALFLLLCGSCYCRYDAGAGTALNLSNVDSQRVDLTLKTQNGVKYASYMPHEDVEITTILHGESVVWRGYSGRSCVLLNTYSKTGCSTLVALYTKGHGIPEPLYYEVKFGNKWVPIVETDFIEKIEKMRASHDVVIPPTEAPRNIQGPAQAVKKTNSEHLGEPLNIAGIDPTKVNLNVVANDDVKQVSYLPIDLPFSEVSDGNDVFWKAGEGEKCTGLHTYDDGKNAELLAMYIKKGSDLRCKYFLKCNTWKEIPKKEFDGRHLHIYGLIPEYESSASGLVLDLSHADASQIYVSENTNGASTHKSFFPKGDSFFESIQDGKVTIWTAEGEEKCTIVYSNSTKGVQGLTLNINNDENTIFRYFVKAEGEWKSATRKGYDELLASDVVFGLTLDISNVDYTTVKRVVNTSDGLKYVSYLPEDDSFFGRILDKDVELWTATSAQECSTVFVYSKKSSPYLLSLFFKHDSKYVFEHYENFGGMWNKVSEEDFNEKVAALKALKYEAYKLDISNMDKNKVTVSSETYSGITHTITLPKGTVSIVSVTDKSQNIWSGDMETTCTFLGSYSKEGHSDIVYLRAVSGGNTYYNYYENKNNRWTPITEQEFTEKHSDMKRELSPEEIYAKYGLSFNLSVFDPAKVRTLSVSRGISFRAYHAKDKHFFKEVSEGGNLVWTGEMGRECYDIYLYLRKSFPDLLALNVKNGASFSFVYFENMVTSWNEITEEEFYEKLKELEVKPQMLDDVIDLTHLHDVEEFKPFEDSPYVVLKYVPEVAVKKVVEGPYNLWKSSGDEACISASFYVKEKRHLLAQLVVEGGVVDLTTLYYERRTFGWYNITRELFDFKVEKLRSVSDAFLTVSFYTVSLLSAVVYTMTML